MIPKTIIPSFLVERCNRVLVLLLLIRGPFCGLALLWLPGEQTPSRKIRAVDVL